jgi:hypothetical protein
MWLIIKQTYVFASTHVTFLVNIYVANKNATSVFAILVANYIGVFDTKLS